MTYYYLFKEDNICSTNVYSKKAIYAVIYLYVEAQKAETVLSAVIYIYLYITADSTVSAF